MTTDAAVLPAAALAALVDRVDRRAFAAALVDELGVAVPGYAKLPQAVLRGQVRAIVERNLELAVARILSDATPAPDDVEELRASARNRAAEGLSLSDLLGAYRLGIRRYWLALRAAARENEEGLLLGVADALMVHEELAASVVAQTFADERQHLVADEAQRLRRLFESLVRDEEPDGELAGLSERMGLAGATSYSPFVLALPGAPAHAHSQVAAALRLDGRLALTEGELVVGVLPAGREPNGPATSALVAVGEAVGRAELADALVDLRLVVMLAAASGRDAGRVEPEAFAAALLLSRAPRLGAQLRRRVLEPLEATPRLRRAELQRSLEVYLALDRNRRATARALRVHPNSLDHRIARIEELTGLDLRRTDDLVAARLAVLAASTAISS